MTTVVVIVEAMIALFAVIAALFTAKSHLLSDNENERTNASFYIIWAFIALIVVGINVLTLIFVWSIWVPIAVLILFFILTLFSKNADMAAMLAELAVPFGVALGFLLLHAIPGNAGLFTVGKCIFWPVIAVVAIVICGLLRHTRKPWVIVVTILAILATLGCVLAYGADSGWFKRELSEAELDVIESDLTVDLDDVSGYYANVSWEFLDYQMPNRDKERVSTTGYSNAVSFPFKSKDKDEAYLEVQEEILRSPVYGDMAAQGLATIKLSSGKTLTELNPWLVEFLEKHEAAMALPEDDAVRGNEVWLTLREGEGNTIFVTKEYREYATRICILLDRLVNKGFVTNKTSVANYALNDAVYGSSRRTYASSIQESKPALILQYIRKEDDGAEVTIGFNQIDKRLEIFKEDKPVEPTNPTDPSPTNPPVNPTPTPVDPKPTPVDPDPPTKKKDPQQSSGNTGNAKKAGVVEDGVDDKTEGPFEPASSVKEPDGKTIITQPETTPPKTETEKNVTVDNGTPPPTDPIPVQKSSYGDGAVENNGGNNGKNNEENVHDSIADPFS